MRIDTSANDSFSHQVQVRHEHTIGVAMKQARQLSKRSLTWTWLATVGDQNHPDKCPTGKSVFYVAGTRLLGWAPPRHHITHPFLPGSSCAHPCCLASRQHGLQTVACEGWAGGRRKVNAKALENTKRRPGAVVMADRTFDGHEQ